MYHDIKYQGQIQILTLKKVQINNTQIVQDLTNHNLEKHFWVTKKTVHIFGK